MDNYNLMNRIRSFFGLRSEPPRSDFRNPIWGSDDEDDGDELYTRANFDDPVAFQREMSRQMEEVFRTFSNMFGDLSSFFEDVRPPGHWQGAIMDVPSEPEGYDNNNLRDYYLRPGYQNQRQDYKDVDLDGKVSSDDISGLLKQKDKGEIVPVTPFDGNLVPGRSFCQTIITTSVTQPDGTIETRRIVKKGDNVVEETVTTTEPTTRCSYSSPSPIAPPSYIFTSLSSILKNFY